MGHVTCCKYCSLSSVPKQLVICNDYSADDGVHPPALLTAINTKTGERPSPYRHRLLRNQEWSELMSIATPCLPYIVSMR